MPPIEVGAPRAIGAVSAELARKTSLDTSNAQTVGSAAGTTARAASVAQSAVATSTALEAGQAPVDTDRVSEIRKAVESGKYPLVPARIADAMIAAGMLLRSGKA